MNKDIPPSRLRDGIKLGLEHVKKMIDSGETLLRSGHHPTSITISILAHEELAKLRDMVVHFRDQKSITRNEWGRMSGGGSHSTKLAKLYDDVLNEVIQMGETHHKYVQELNQKIGGNDIADFSKLANMRHQISLLKNLNYIKKECIYLDWKDGNWITFEVSTSAYERAALAKVLHIQNLLTFLTVLLEHKYPAVPMDEQSPEFMAYRDDPLRRQISNIEEKTKTKAFMEIIQTATSVISRYSKQVV